MFGLPQRKEPKLVATVDAIMADLQRKVDQLRAAADQQQKVADVQQKNIETATTRRDAALAESARADSVAQRLLDLLK